MWPRADASFGPGADLTAARKAKGSGLNGFVSYMTRRDAEDALREFDGHEWQGSVLRVGWSKAVAIAAKPIYGEQLLFFFTQKTRLTTLILVLENRKTRDSRSRSPSADRYRSLSHERYRSRSYSRDRDRSRSPRRRRSTSHSRRHRRSESLSRSRSPDRLGETEGVTDTFIRAVAAELKGHDERYDGVLREFEKNNPKYAFMLKRDVCDLFDVELLCLLI